MRRHDFSSGCLDGIQDNHIVVLQLPGCDADGRLRTTGVDTTDVLAKLGCPGTEVSNSWLGSMGYLFCLLLNGVSVGEL